MGLSDVRLLDLAARYKFLQNRSIFAMKPNWGRIAQIGGYGITLLMLLGVRNANLSPPDEAPIAMQASFANEAERAQTYSDQQLEAGQNLLSNLVLSRATYLWRKAKDEGDNAEKWLDEYRGQKLGELRAADDKRGGIWTGEAEDNAYAPVVVESLAIELAKTWIANQQATPLENHSFTEYLNTARLAGGIGGYDPFAMQLYLEAIGVLEADRHETAN
jgi:hypothetical protein